MSRHKCAAMKRFKNWIYEVYSYDVYSRSCDNDSIRLNDGRRSGKASLHKGTLTGIEHGGVLYGIKHKKRGSIGFLFLI
jgi:hypothetical protein